MNSYKWMVLLWSLAVIMSACGSDGSDDENGSQVVNVQVMTGDLSDASLTTATLKGSVTSSASSYAEVGIAYCLENDDNNMMYAQATDFESGYANRRFSVTISGLQPDAAYTYCAYAKETTGKLIHASDKRVFRTKSPVELLTSATVQWVAINDATLCWDLSEDNAYAELLDGNHQVSFGIAWSTEQSDITPGDSRFTSHSQTVGLVDGQRTLIKISSLMPSTTYYYSTYVNLNGTLYATPVSSFVTMSENASSGKAPSGAAVVDMGLPSGTKWSNMNVGAEKAEDSGLFFAWGETTGYTFDGSDGHLFGWTSYKWCNGGRSSQTKYCSTSEYGVVDNKLELDLADDAAFVNWGGNWRMPTHYEMQELVEHTRSEWTTQNGVDGYKFTSKITGHSIFFPAAGCRVSESNYEKGTDCYYWTTTVDAESPYASRYLRFYVGKVFLASMFRYYGMNVRPVLR
jgi:hypothetical protein